MLLADALASHSTEFHLAPPLDLRLGAVLRGELAPHLLRLVVAHLAEPRRIG